MEEIASYQTESQISFTQQSSEAGQARSIVDAKFKKPQQVPDEPKDDDEQSFDDDKEKVDTKEEIEFTFDNRPERE